MCFLLDLPVFFSLSDCSVFVLILLLILLTLFSFLYFCFAFFYSSFLSDNEVTIMVMKDTQVTSKDLDVDDEKRGGGLDM